LEKGGSHFENGSHVEKWFTLRKNGSHLEKWVTLGKKIALGEMGVSWTPIIIFICYVKNRSKS